MLKFLSMNREQAGIIIEALRPIIREKKRTKKINSLVHRKIDRKFHLDLNELTPAELDFEMGRRAAHLKENADPRVYLNMKSGRNKMVKLLLIIPFFFRLIFLKPVSIFRDFVFFNNALLVRMRKADARIGELEHRIDILTDRDCLGNSDPEEMDRGTR